MKKEAYKIHIIGAGISGLIAASVLEKNGFSPTIIEASDSFGGRVKTDIVSGYQLDHGFQVLLTAYPAAQKHLDFDALELQQFLPGAAILKKGKQTIIGDPLRDTSLFFSTLSSGIGSVSDKIKILKLNNILKKKSILEIFKEEEQTTLSYLQNFGFSTAVINDFFIPFFTGIFLETKLETSSRMFEFIYKMFGEGNAALPKNGIEAISKQLFDKLKNTTFKFNTKVTTIKDNEILVDGNTTKLQTHFTIVATDASYLIPNLNQPSQEWKSCNTLYFETEKRIIKKPLIGLISDENTLINNIFYHTSIKTNNTSKKELLSVTVVDDKGLSDDAIIIKVQEELEKHCGIDLCNFIKSYKIPMALPKLSNIQYEKLPSETRLTNSIFLAGDTQLNGSLNAAMISGEKAALGVINTILKN